MEKGLNKFFEDYLKKDPIFLNKKALQSNYTPEIVPHREEQVQQLASILAPALRNEKPSNVFIFGKTGSGKTCVSLYVTNQIKEMSEKSNLNVKVCYLNCKLKKVADTEYRLIAELGRAVGVEVPATGLPTDQVYHLFLTKIDEKSQLLILILDEIDQLVNKAGDGILYNLTRLNSELKNCQLSFIGISNDLMFIDGLDSRIKSSLSEEELVFPPYNALQLQDILRERAEIAFRKTSLDSGVIEKCAAYAAREHGDARRALELLRVAGELAERNNELKVSLIHLDEAEEKIEKDRVLDMIKIQPKQVQLALYAILSSCANCKKNFTGEVFDFYSDCCKKAGLLPLTQRRISDIIGELDMFGIINAKVISKGRYGRTREISVAIPGNTIPGIKQVLKEGLGL